MTVQSKTRDEENYLSEGAIMSFDVEDDLVEPEEDKRSPQRCTGYPFACPCEACLAFRYDYDDAERERESEEGQEAA